MMTYKFTQSNKKQEIFPSILTWFLCSCLIIALFSPAYVLAANWPTYRNDNNRSGVTGESLSVPLNLQWTIDPGPAPAPAWPLPAEELPRMHSDSAYHITAAEGIAYFGSSVLNQVYAVDVKLGKILWSFRTAGPVRFAPTLDSGRIYFGSDDGYVYCLDAKQGTLIWKYRAGPSEEKVIGSGRMISSWPVRTSIIVDNDQALFAAGVFPFEGIFICCLNPDDGTVIWKNDTVGDRAHDLQFGGISPQGYLLASENTLFVPSGRATPAAFNRKTGDFLFYTAPGGKQGGTWALLDSNTLIAGVEASGNPVKITYDAKTGRRQGTAYAWFPGLDMVVTDRFSYTLTSDGIYAIDRAAYKTAQSQDSAARARQKRLNRELTELRKKLAQADEKTKAKTNERIDELTQQIHQLGRDIDQARKSSLLWQFSGKNFCTLILTDNVLITGGDGFIAAIDIEKGRSLWFQKISGKAISFAVSDQRLFVSTDQGPIYCFGPDKVTPQQIKTFAYADKIIPAPDVKSGGSSIPHDNTIAELFAKQGTLYQNAAQKIIKDSGITKGYCLVLDCGAGLLAYELAKRTELHIIGIEKDPKLLETARNKFEAAGLLGSRVVVESWELSDLPPYFANLIISDQMLITGTGTSAAQDWYRLLKPYGGIAMFGAPKNGEIAWNRVKRGELEGAGSWTALYGNTQNTACSEDKLVKEPFGVLWYGEPGPKEIVDRHGRSTSPVSINGRIFHQGEEVIMAYDAYNGTFLWKRYIPGAVRVRVDVDGGNLALTKDALYVAAHDKCYRLDPATGKTIRTYDLPPAPNSDARRWGYISAVGNILYGIAADPLKMEYAAVWKDFVDDQKCLWKDEDEISEETFEEWDTEKRLKSAYNSLKNRYPVPDENLRMDLQRSGTLWHPMDDFPSWNSQRTPKNALTDRLMAGDTLFALDTDTGKTLWTHQGKRIPNISVTIADGVVFFVEDNPTDQQVKTALEEKDTLVEKGIYEVGKEAALIKTPEEADVRMAVALNAVTGETIWRKPLELTGCGGDKMGSAYKDGVLLFFGHFSNHDTGFFKNNELTWRRITALDTKSAQVLWSRPLNYLRRPLIVGNTVIIEPRACDLKTGAIKTRSHPISGQDVEWEFLRPGHCCAITSASADTLFYRSFFAAIYELSDDKGLSLFGAIRPGCWLNMISANGLMLMPEASSGCTCSFPLRCSLALVPKPKITSNWTVFITHGPMTPAKHFAINFGAPGDMKDANGTLWFAYPRPRAVSGIGYGEYGVKFNLKENFADRMGFFRNDYRGVNIAGSDKPWLFTSGGRGIISCVLPLIDGSSQKPGTYTLRLGFCAPASDQPGQRVFDVKAQGEPILINFDIISQTHNSNTALIKEFKGIKVDNTLTLEFVPKSDDLTFDQAPIINFVEVIRQDLRPR